MREARLHGGALGAAIERFGGAPADWLDLSTGIQPCPPPLPPISPEAWTRLPERAAEDELRASARRCFGTPSDAPVVLAPGTQSLISLWPHLFTPADAAVVGPTYAEHGQALAAAGHRVRTLREPADLPADVRLLVVVNPNNPDGRLFERADLLRLAETMAGRDGLLVVDEAFSDADPRESVSPDAGRPGLLILRSFGKFFGLAGLRLGFALAEPDLAARLQARLGPWAVSGPALAVGSALMGDAALVRRQRERAQEQSNRLRGVLLAAGLSIQGGTALFTLVRHEKAGALFEALGCRRILTRPFDEPADWLRFGNPADESQSRRLARALAEALVEIGP